MVVHCRRDREVQSGLCGEFYDTTEVYKHFFAYPDFFYSLVAGEDVMPGRYSLCEVCTSHKDYPLILLGQA
jgi:hypothetical protein